MTFNNNDLPVVKPAGLRLGEQVRRFSCPLAVVLALACVFAWPGAAQTLKRIERSDFGITREGEKVEMITLRNARGMSAQIITYGAILKELEAPDRNGNFTNILLATDGVTYKLAKNSGKNTIHGGRKGFGKVVWSIEDSPIKEQESSVRLTYLSKDGEEGFPGNLTVAVTYTLTDHNELRLEYEAKTDKPTIVNLTNHAYWNLAGGGTCLDNVLWIPAKSYTPANAESIPTGEILPLAGTPMDFNAPTRIGERIEQLEPQMTGYDHNYILGEDKVMKPAARLFEPVSGRIMEVRTSQPAVQLYTGNHLGHTGVCLEKQHYPDAIHHPNFPSIVFSPGETLQETTLFTFLTDRSKP